jgi:O-antigen/teichoic acid export membrane protein
MRPHGFWPPVWETAHVGSVSQRSRALAAGGASIAVAIAVMNLASYASTLLAARLLGPRQYGGFAAFSGLLLVVSVVMLGLQTTGARRIAAAPDHVGEIERTLMRVTYRAAWVLAGACLLLTPVFDAALHLQSVVTAAMLALVVWPMSVVGGQVGVLQGERRWLPLAGIYLSMGLSRLAGTLLLLWKPQESVAALAMAIGFAVPVVVGGWALRGSAVHRSQESSGHHDERSVLRSWARTPTRCWPSWPCPTPTSS